LAAWAAGCIGLEENSYHPAAQAKIASNEQFGVEELSNRRGLTI
jgi:hypothetical protein